MVKIIFFQAHPIDLEFFCAHLIHYLAERKDKFEIKIASLTRGEFSTPPHGFDHFKGHRLGKMREGELYIAHKEHGISRDQIHFFGLIDQMVRLNKKTINLVKQYLEKEKPDIVFAPEPIHTYYRHQDHVAVGKIIFFIYDKLLLNENPKLYYFAPLNPNFFWPFKKKDIPFAFKLLDIHKSPAWMMKYVKPLYGLLGKSYGRNVKGWKYAEGYRKVFFRANYNKNKKINFRMKFISILSKTLWPTDLSKYVSIPDEYKDT